MFRKLLGRIFKIRNEDKIVLVLACCVFFFAFDLLVEPNHIEKTMVESKEMLWRHNSAPKYFLIHFHINGQKHCLVVDESLYDDINPGDDIEVKCAITRIFKKTEPKKIYRVDKYAS